MMTTFDVDFDVNTVARTARRGVRAGRRRLPWHLTDRVGRGVQVREAKLQDWEGVLAMYRGFDPAQRAQGLPPYTEERLVAWVDELWRRGPNVVARSGGRVVGHAALVPYDGDGSYELAIFVHQDYQGAGIGGALIDAALARARRRGATRVWLSVDRHNHRAIALYRRMGFQRVSADEEETWILAAPAAAARGMTSRGGSSMSLASGIRVRLRGLAGAVRFAWIPIVCAAVVALASEQPRGRALATVLAFVSLGLGLAVHTREIILGRRAERRPPSAMPPDTGEWMAALR
jgi:ribosomal protein S18 acetylase RimI-like enzyme